MFTTGLEPNALAMTGVAGLHPIGQVMGACVFHSKFIRGDVKLTGRRGMVYLYPTVVESVRSTREQALRRLARDGRDRGADAVAGVRVSHEEQYWGTDGNAGTVESVVTGIAVAWQDRRSQGGEPVLTDLGVQEYWKLAQGGYAPAGMVMSTVMTGCIARRWPANAPVVDTPGQLKWENYEYEEVSDMVHSACQCIDEDIREQGLAMGAEGIIGVQFDSRKWRDKEQPQYFKMIVIVTVVGTAVVATRDDGVERPGQRLPGPVARLLGDQTAPDGDAAPAARQPRLRITPVRHTGATASSLT
jgi:uncharacterized protein YbjQ (UPF0145 family)